jgi:hypothetical protein
MDVPVTRPVTCYRVCVAGEPGAQIALQRVASEHPRDDYALALKATDLLARSGQRACLIAVHTKRPLRYSVVYETTPDAIATRDAARSLFTNPPRRRRLSPLAARLV